MDPSADRPGAPDPAGPPASAPPIERERTLRGIPLWLVRSYLEDLGARPSGDPTRERVALVADAWGATLEQVADFQIGSLRVGQVRLTLSGEDAALRPMLAALEKRLFRGGG